MTVITATKLSSKGQIVIPKAIRKELGLREGDTLIIASHGDTLILKKLSLRQIIAETDEQYRQGRTLSLEEAFEELV